MRLAAAIAVALLVGSGYVSADSGPRYSVIPLRLLPGTETEETAHCELRALNSKGESAGSAGAQGRFRAVWWDARGSIHLLGKPSDHLSEAEGINDSEQVIAYATDSYYTLTARLFVVDRQGEHLITPPKGTETRGFIGGEAINNAGQVAFNVQTATGFPFRAVLSGHGTLTELGHLPLRAVNAQFEALTAYTHVHALNNFGMAVGESETRIAGKEAVPTHAFLWQRGTMTDLGVLPSYDDSSATALNDRGDIIGTVNLRAEQSDSAPFFQGHGFLWRHGVMTDLGTLPGCRYTEPMGINNSGVIVGDSYNIENDSDGFSQTGGALNSGVFLWQNGKMQDLQTLVPTGWELQSAVAINDRGDILCTGTHDGMPSRTLGSGGFILHRL